MNSAPTRGAFGNLTSVRWAKPNELGQIAGACQDFTLKRGIIKYKTTFEITIKPDPQHPWLVMSTVMHEMGHCVHGFVHTDDPQDIMYASLIINPENEAYWKKNLIFKLNEMFEKTGRRK
jgi:hypothetical protein